MNENPPNLWIENLEEKENKSSGKKPRTNLKTFLLQFSIVATLSGAIFFWGFWQANLLLDNFQSGAKKLEVEKALPELNQSAANPLAGLKDETTILLIGSDIRTGESGYGRSDTILVLRLYPKKNAASVLSLPRDLLVDIPGYGPDKINAAYSYGGTELLIATIREYLGVPINHFFRVDFGGFSRALAALGGVYLPIDQRYYHSNEGLSTYEQYSEIDIMPGYQKLGFEDALAWVRYRHGDDDFYRAARQQLFLRETGRELRQEAQDPYKLKELLEIFADATTSDLSSAEETFSLANTLRQIPPDRINRVTIEADAAYINGVSYLQASDDQKEAAVKQWADIDERLSKQPQSNINKKEKKKMNTDSLQKSEAILKNLFFQTTLQSSYSLSSSYKKFLQEELEIIAKTASFYVPPPKPEKIERRVEEEILVDSSDASKLTENNKLQTCTPTQLPENYYYGEDPSYEYTLAEEYPAQSLYATEGSGRSVLWMWTTWEDPPILESPSATLETKKHSYSLYYESQGLRMISWKEGNTQAWITNTLRNELSEEEMISLAETCA